MTVKDTILKLLYTEVKEKAVYICKGNKYDADDLVQNVALKALRHIEYFFGKDELHIKNILIKNLKWAKADIWCNDFYKAPPTVSIINCQKAVENDAYENLNLNDIQKELLQLSKTQFSYFRLKIEGYNCTEIGKIKNKHPKTVYESLIRAKQYLIKQLKAA